MARLNVMRTIEETRPKINVRYDIGIDDIELICTNSPHPYYLVANSFTLGYAQGMKAAKAEMKRREK
jgi:hypothetical protein